MRLFGKKDDKVTIESQRDTVIRVVDELNAVIALMADKPKVGLDLNTGLLTVELPEQMPDEALALPAPSEKVEDVVEDVKEDIKDVAEEAVDEATDAVKAT